MDIYYIVKCTDFKTNCIFNNNNNNNSNNNNNDNNNSNNNNNDNNNNKNNNNNNKIAYIALPPSTRDPQLWTELLIFKPECATNVIA